MTMSRWPVLPYVGEPYSTIVLTLTATYLFKPTLKVLGLALAAVYRFVRGSGEKGDLAFEPGVVYLYMFPRAYTRQLVNLSPFAVKLETWLRLKKIPYKVVETRKFSKSTRQIPYIRLDGEEVADTVFIIDYLMEKFRLDPLEGSSKEEQAITRAFHRMADESLALTYFWFRYYIFPDQFSKLFRIYKNNAFISRKATGWIGKSVHARAVAGGLGRHTAAEVGVIGADDVRALGRMLGDKKFMFGDNIRLLDCIAFAHLSHVLIDVDFPHKAALDEPDCAALMPYMQRIKDELWPDWHDLVDMAPFK